MIDTDTPELAVLSAAGVQSDDSAAALRGLVRPATLGGVVGRADGVSLGRAMGTSTPVPPDGGGSTMALCCRPETDTVGSNGSMGQRG